MKGSPVRVRASASPDLQGILPRGQRLARARGYARVHPGDRSPSVKGSPGWRDSRRFAGNRGGVDDGGPSAACLAVTRRVPHFPRRTLASSHAMGRSALRAARLRNVQPTCARAGRCCHRGQTRSPVAASASAAVSSGSRSQSCARERRSERPSHRVPSCRGLRDVDGEGTANSPSVSTARRPALRSQRMRAESCSSQARRRGLDFGPPLIHLRERAHVIASSQPLGLAGRARGLAALGRGVRAHGDRPLA